MAERMTVLYLQVGNSGVYWLPQGTGGKFRPTPCACSGQAPKGRPGECNCQYSIRLRAERRAIVGLKP